MLYYEVILVINITIQKDFGINSNQISLLEFCLLFQKKCEQYWPTASKHYGGIEVKLDSESKLADYVTRSFTLKKVSGLWWKYSSN